MFFLFCFCFHQISQSCPFLHFQAETTGVIFLLSGQVFGHNDIDIAEQDPYFDVIDYIESIFRKTNVTTDPSSNPPLSPTEINVQ